MRLDEPCLEDVANSAHSTEAKMKSLKKTTSLTCGAGLLG